MDQTKMSAAQTQKTMQAAEIQSKELSQLRSLKAQAMEVAMRITGGRPKFERTVIEPVEDRMVKTGTEWAIEEAGKIYKFYTEVECS